MLIKIREPNRIHCNVRNAASETDSKTTDPLKHRFARHAPGYAAGRLVAVEVVVFGFVSSFTVRQPDFKACVQFLKKDLKISVKMEAGGFEPPSRDISSQTSTCVVALLGFRLNRRRTTGFGSRYFAKVSLLGRKHARKPVCYATSGAHSQTQSAGTGRSIRQPFCTGSCQLN